jgi:DNA-binding CsgD family transcriptional regulator
LLPYETTDPAEHRRVAAEAEEALRRASGAFPPGLSPRRAWLGVLSLEGRWSEVWEIAADSPTHGNYNLRGPVTATLAPLARHQADPDAAWAQLRPILPRGPATEPGGCVHQDALLLQRLAAELELDRGNHTAALAWLQANDRWLAWNGGVLGRADNRVVWGRYHAATGDLAAARVHAAEALRLAGEPRQPLALLAAHRLAGDLALDAGDAAVAGRHLGDALALADACAAPHERALTLLPLARLRASEGRGAEAAALLTEVRALCAPLAARRTLAAADDLAATLTAPAAALPAGLTPREVEVLRLVAQGLTDAEVGGRLFISPRTVGQHLRSIYAKLDVSSRAGATRFAVERRLV